ncbi:alpha/beta hydrolase [Marinibaculum pumilum]|uniref:Alpha/beta hydrolase n=1 Tax=Marinibaculum pumilum TaxID=1766165 RepID=A0ABV7KX53_9PROT
MHRPNRRTPHGWRLLRRLALAALATLPAIPSGAGEMPAYIAAEVAALGPAIEPVATARIYAPIHVMQPPPPAKVARDIAYGDDPRQVLDLFAPEGGGTAPKPVLVFVHGGAFVRGNKTAPGSPFYDNVMNWAVATNMIGVNITYRLAPDHPWPAGAEDVAAALAWVRDNVAAHGGDPARIFLMGHSAGAVHVASYAAQPQFHVAPGGGLAGAILVSGVYDLAGVPARPPMSLYFGDDPARFAERGALDGLVAGAVPVMVVDAELEPPVFHRQADRLEQALCAAGRCPARLHMTGHNHMSEIYAIGTGDTLFTDAIRTFVAGSRQKPGG